MTRQLLSLIAGSSVLLAACEFEPVASPQQPEPQFAAAAAALNQDLARVRAATARFHDVNAALAEGYVPVSECVAMPGEGGMGIHFLNFGLAMDAGYSPTTPEALLYQPQDDGSLRLVGVEYVIVQAAWHAAGNDGLPDFRGHPFESMPAIGPNPPTYTLHAWIWAPNPNGMFAPYNPAVKCPAAAEAAPSHSH